ERFECQETFKLRARFLGSVDIEERVCALMHGLDLPGINRQRSVIALQRFVWPAERRNGVAAHVPAFRAVWSDRKKMVIGFERFLLAPEAGQRATAFKERRQKAGLDPQNLV